MNTDEIDDLIAGHETRIAALEADTGGGGGDPAPTPGGGGGTLFIASSTAPSAVKARADVVCTGNDDNRTINEAVKAISNQFTTEHGQKNPQYGSVILSDGLFNLAGPILVPSRGFALRGTSLATVLRPSVSASAFDINGARSVTGNKALVMAAEGAVGGNTSKAFLDTFSCWCEQWGSGSALSGIYISLDDVPESGSTAPVTYGLPIPTNKNDQNWVINNIHVYGCEFGIGWDTTDGGRDFFIRDCWVGAVSKAGIYAGASDSQIQGCQVITTTADGGIGISLSGGNSKLWNSKLSYVDIGVKVTSGRVTINGVEAQDCGESFMLAGTDDLTSSGCKVDTQETGNIGFDLYGCTRFAVSGLTVHTRGSGTFATGINLPSGSEVGTIQATVGDAGIAKQVAKGGSEITSSDQCPDGLIVQIAREGAGNIVSGGNVA